VLTNPVGKTQILSFLANQTLDNPKKMAVNSKTINRVEYDWYCAKK
jgi:hypothetical protein